MLQLHRYLFFGTKSRTLGTIKQHGIKQYTRVMPFKKKCFSNYAMCYVLLSVRNTSSYSIGALLINFQISFKFPPIKLSLTFRIGFLSQLMLCLPSESCGFYAQESLKICKTDLSNLEFLFCLQPKRIYLVWSIQSIISQQIPQQLPVGRPWGSVFGEQILKLK